MEHNGVRQLQQFMHVGQELRLKPVSNKDAVAFYCQSYHGKSILIEEIQPTIIWVLFVGIHKQLVKAIQAKAMVFGRRHKASKSLVLRRLRLPSIRISFKGSISLQRAHLETMVGVRL